jgi:hypothetical protein
MTRPTWFTITLTSLLVLIAGLAVGFGHGGVTATLREPGPLGLEIGDLYGSMVRATAAAVSHATSPDALEPQLDAIRHRYGSLFARLGVERDKLGPDDRGAVTNTAESAMHEVPETQLRLIRRYADAHRVTAPGVAAKLDDVLRLEQLATVGRLPAHHLPPAICTTTACAAPPRPVPYRTSS